MQFILIKIFLTIDRDYIDKYFHFVYFEMIERLKHILHRSLDPLHILHPLQRSLEDVTSITVIIRGCDIRYSDHWRM